jgi:hypothetical protein
MLFRIAEHEIFRHELFPGQFVSQNRDGTLDVGLLQLGRGIDHCQPGGSIEGQGVGAGPQGYGTVDKAEDRPFLLPIDGAELLIGDFPAETAEDAADL